MFSHSWVKAQTIHCGKRKLQKPATLENVWLWGCVGEDVWPQWNKNGGRTFKSFLSLGKQTAVQTLESSLEKPQKMTVFFFPHFILNGRNPEYYLTGRICSTQHVLFNTSGPDFFLFKAFNLLHYRLSLGSHKKAFFRLPRCVFEGVLLRSEEGA